MSPHAPRERPPPTDPPPEEPVNLRAASLDDLPLLVRFNAEMAQVTEGRTLDTERLTRGVRRVLEDPARGRYLVAEDDDGELLGGLMVTTEWSDWRDGWFWWIQSVFVREAARRRGVYRALHEHVRAEARARGDVCGLRLYVEYDNGGAQAVYERVGMGRAHYHMFEEDFVLG